MKVMRGKHISKEMDKHRKSMQNDYVKKMAAAKVDPNDYKKDNKDNFENENLQMNEETLIDFDEHEYNPMNQNCVRIERTHNTNSKLQ